MRVNLGGAWDTSRELVAAANEYIARGWAVLICEPRGKRPVLSRGLNDATKSQEKVADWWQRWPLGNIGLATGYASGFWVLDVDGNDGESSLRALEAERGALPQTAMALTGGGGLHFLFAMPADGDVRNSARKIAPGLDVRGTGGYIVAPPSLHPSGRRYAWEGSCHPDDVPIVQAPAWLLTLVRATPAQSDKGKAAGEHVPIPSGQRNATLASRAGVMRRAGFGEAEIVAALLETNRRCDPPLLEREVLAIAHSIARYEPVPGRAPGTGVGSLSPQISPPTLLPIHGNGAKMREPGEDEIEVQADRPPDDEPKPPRQYPLLRISEILAMEPQGWIVDQWIPDKSLVVLYGMPGAAKSFIAISICLAVAAGIRWLGGYEVEPAPVLYCAGEGLGCMRLRLLAAATIPEDERAAAGISGVDILAAAENTVRFLPCVPRLLEGEDQLLAIHTVEAMNPKPKVTIIDTLSRGLLGAEENSSKDVGQAVQFLDAIKRMTNGSVLVIHHSGKDQDKGMRGSSALLGAADLVIAAKKVAGSESSLLGVILSVEKNKDGKPPEPLTLALPEVSLGLDERQREVSSLRVRFRTASEARAAGSQKDAQILALFGPHALPEGGTLASVVRAAAETGLEASKPTVFRALSRLCSEGQLKKDRLRYVLADGKE